MATTYERGSGQFVAERVRPVEGSEEAQRYEALAEDRASGWRRVADAPAEPEEEHAGPLERPVKSASKADWKAYVISQGMDDEVADKATRDELAALYVDGGES
ncbi:hypothetical protein J7I98_04420 [Streptomyces sp. ISL-98]|uniref:hypothetical protein n=1 Tax=Streptomyces sp. ISL-98 TaxID=2819192 RepID=UPI001BE64060|nr:hypothetical protein [Streptomyces sp. ISL-98]MBT2505153.1 hypothetical protein [Streptomyces sp. ISL-98]